MTTELWVTILSACVVLITFWLRDWKEKIEAALAVKQRKIDEQDKEITALKVAVAGCVKHEELTALRNEIARSFTAEVDRVIAVMEAKQ